MNPPETRKDLQNLSCVTEEEVRYPVLLAPCKPTDLDPIPISLGKDFIDISSYTDIINNQLITL